MPSMNFMVHYGLHFTVNVK